MEGRASTPAAALGSVGVNYLPVNSAPVVDEIVVVPGARAQRRRTSRPASRRRSTSRFPHRARALPAASTPDSERAAARHRRTARAITVRWAAHDDNGDDLVYSLYLRGDGETVWRLLKDQITDKAYSFDATLIPDGGYQIKVVASDAPSHTPGDALTGEKVERAIRSRHHAAGGDGFKAERGGGNLRARALRRNRSQSPSMPKMRSRRSRTPSTRSTPARGSSSIPWARSPTRGASTTTAQSASGCQTARPAST